MAEEVSHMHNFIFACLQSVPSRYDSLYLLAAEGFIQEVRKYV